MINELLDAVHTLLDEIDKSDYVDMVGSSEALTRVIELTGWPSKARIYGTFVDKFIDTKAISPKEI